jgi:hypothetical protein
MILNPRRYSGDFYRKYEISTVEGLHREVPTGTLEKLQRGIAACTEVKSAVF